MPGITVTATFRPRRTGDRTLQLPHGSTVGDLVRAVGATVDSTLVVRGSTPVPEDDALRDGETLLLLSAFSGG